MGHFTFDEVDGTSVLDSSTSEVDHLGVLENGAQIESSNSFLGDFVSLAGGNQVVAIQDSQEINLGQHAQRTLGVWFRVDEFGAEGTKQVIYEEGAGARGLSIYLDGDRLYVGGWNRPDSDWTGTFLSTDAVEANTWHHVALVLDAEEGVTQPQANAFSAYLDGQQFGSGEGSQLWEHSNDIGLGGHRQGTRFHDGFGSGDNLSLKGDIGDFRLYNRVLSAAEISELAVQPEPPSENVAVFDDAVVHLTLNETGGTIATDNQATDGEQSATLQNGAVFQSGFSNGTISLDGIDDYLSLEDSALINLAEHPKRSIGVWFKLDSISTDGRKQVIYEEGGGGRGLSLYVQDEQLYVGGWNVAEGNWRGTFLSTDGIAADTWHHVMLVLDAEPGLAQVQANALTGYLDGIQFGAGEGMQLWPHGSDIGIGATNQDTRFHDGTARGIGTNAFGGAIADFQLYNRALSPDDVEFLATLATDPVGTTSASVALAEDTGATGTDGITQNPTVTGQVEAYRTGVAVRASLNGQPSIEITDQVLPSGEFSLSEADLEVLLGSALIDGEYQLVLEVVDGTTVVPTTLAFTLDRSNPSLTLESPLVNGIHGLEGRLVGEISDQNDIAVATYQLDGGVEDAITLDAEGRFNLPLLVDAGLHQLQFTVTDSAGNETTQQLDFSADASVGAIAPVGSQGWSGTTPTSAVLGEGNSLVNEARLDVLLGQEEGSRTLAFDVQALFDLSDANGLKDRLSVYLVNDVGETLVDMGVAGTPVFALSESGAEFQPGVVSYNGTTVEIDVSAVEASTPAQLVFQLLNADGDTGTVIRVDQLTNTLDPEGSSNPTFPMNRTVVRPGAEIAIDSLSPSTDLVATLKQVRFDTATGTYRADLQVANTGEETLGRSVAIAVANLPDGVTVQDESGFDDNGNPYFNFQPAIRSGGLAPGATSDVIELVVENPNFVPLDWQLQVLSGGVNRAPVFEAIPPVTLMPGTPFELKLEATDPDSDRIEYSLRTNGALPTGGLRGDGTLRFSPTPDQIGTYTVDVVASDGDLETVQSVTLNVVTDAITTTRISGVVQTVEQEALAGVVVSVDEYEAVTADDGTFLIEVPEGSELTEEKLWVLAGDLGGNEAYPSVAEPLELLLGNAPFTGVNNVIDRPIYLPALDIENGATIDPNATETIEVTTANIPGAKVMVEPGNLENQSGDDFSGVLSITEVPIELTPAALPPGLVPDIVVTIQPGEMVFNTAAPLSLPNRSEFGPGVLMDLWSIDPLTGNFRNVGVGQVSEDGSVVETISGGIINSSWHFFSPTPIEATVRTSDNGCQNCGVATGPLSSEVELNTGAVIESHDLVTYESLGGSRGVQLRYDSLRADPRPIVQFGYDDVNPNALAPGFTDKLRLLADLTIHTDEYDYQVPGFTGGEYGLTGGEHFWSIGNQAGPVNASLQADLRDLASGVYDYSLNSGIRLFVRNQFVGTSTRSEGQIVHINRRESAFGAGWGIAGVQELVENSDGSVLLIDGDGSELLFDPPTNGVYEAPAGDFSTLEKLPDGTFRRTMKDQMVYHFDGQNRLISVTDRNGNQTQHLYDGDRLVKFIDPVGLETTFGYTDGKVTSITDPASRVTELNYDAAGNLLEIIDPDTTSRVFEYDAGHRMTAETDKRGNREQTVYNFAGRATQGIQKDGSVIQVEAAQMQGLFEAERTASPFGSPFASSRALGTATYADQDGKVSRTEVDDAGQTVTSRDGSGDRGSVLRDDRNLVTHSRDARGFDDFYTYDDQGNLVKVEDKITIDEQRELTPLTYSVRNGNRGTYHYKDDTYNGNGFISIEGARLSGGVGQLTDGIEGVTDWTTDLGNGPAYEWLGWNSIDPEILFEFNEDTIFSRIDFHLNNSTIGGVFLPSSIEVSFSQDGVNFNNTLSYTTTSEDRADTSARFYSINIPRQEGRYVRAKIRDNTSSRWIFLSEVKFIGISESSADTTEKEIVEFKYDSTFSQLESQTDELGRQTLYEIDPTNGNVLTQTNVVGEVGGPDDQITSLTYTPAGQIDRITDPLGRVTDYDYNPLGRLTKITFAQGSIDEATQEFAYDNAGNQTLLIDENGNETRFEYDALNRLTKLTEADPDGAGPLTSPVTLYVYDENGNLKSVQDARGNLTTYDYDVQDRQTLITDALLGEMRYEYDNFGNIIAETDERGHVTRYHYDARNRLIEIVDPEGAIIQYGYDLENNLTSVKELTETWQTLFFEDFENDLSQWVGKTSLNGESSARIVDDPLENDSAVTFDEIASGGDIFSTEGFSDPNNQFRLSFDYLGLPVDGSNEGSYGGFIGFANVTDSAVAPGWNWLAGTDETSGADPILIDDGLWHRYEIEFTGFSNGDPFFLMLEDHRGVPGDVFFDNIRLEVLPESSFRETRYRYDSRNRLVRETDALGETTIYEYDAVNNLTAVEDRNNHRTEYHYDDLDRLIETKDALDQISSQTYDLANNRLSSTDNLGRTMTYSYDERNRLITTTHPAPFETQSVRYQYDDVGNLRFVTDELDRTTEYVYDGLNREIERYDPLRHRTKYEYDANDNLTAIEDALGRRTSYLYDKLNRQTVRTNALGDTFRTSYDPVGNVTAVRDELNRRTTFAYDKRNDLTQITDPLGHTTSNTYDLLGRTTAERNHLGHTTSYRYDFLDRLIETEDAIGEITRYSYDAEGNLLTLIDAEDNTTSYVYDALDRQISETTAFGTRTYGYDAVSNQTSYTDRNGRTRAYTYDERDRLTNESWLDATDASIHQIDYSYNAASELTQISDNHSRYSYQYDDAGRLIEVDNQGTPALPNVILNYSYDDVNNMTGVTDTFNGQQQGQETYIYDALNRVTQLTQQGGNVANKRVDYSYDAASQMTGSTRYANLAGNNPVASSAYDYDVAGRLTDLTHSRGTNTLAFYSWEYDAINRITKATSIDGVNDYSYNDRDELTATDSSYQEDESYSYDGTGNRTNTGYETGLHNRLLNDGIYSYTYDNEGNRLTRTEIATGVVDEYGWDYRNRLTGILTKDSNGNVIKTVAYTYDAYDRRIEKVVDEDGDDPQEAVTEGYMYDGDHIALVFDGDGNLTHRYLHGPQIDQVLAEETADGQVRWALTDNQGTIRDVIDNQGNVLNHITYDSFGQITEQTNPTAFFRFGYTGREFDTESGQYFYRARYFDPNVGRFISEDPIGFRAGDSNVYRYVFNSPLNYTDPSGNFAITGTLVVGGLFVVASISTLAYLQNNINELSKDIRSNPFPSDDGFFDKPSSIKGNPGQFNPNSINRRRRYTPPFNQDGVIDRSDRSNNFGSNTLGGFGENSSSVSIPGLETFPRDSAHGLLQNCLSSTEDLLNPLPGKRGKTGPIKEVAGPTELDNLYDELLKDGSETLDPGTYPGTVEKASDGAIIRRRPKSKSGGATLDITLPNGKNIKVHIKKNFKP